MNAHKATISGVILMTYGSATTSQHVEEYLGRVYATYGVTPQQELIDDFKHRYDLVGGSPLVELTMKQCAALETSLSRQQQGKYLVRAGMLYSEPFIERAVQDLRAQGATRIVGILLSPQYSPHIMSGYDATLREAARKSDYGQKQVFMVEPWPTQPKFVELLSRRLQEKRAALRASGHTRVPILFTTHSLPQRVVEKDPAYLNQLRATAKAVAAHADLADHEWQCAYQSAGHTPEPWLKPDIVDILPQLKRSGHRALLIVPLQFLTDHLEILYDLDVAAKEQCAAFDIAYHRIELPNTDPLLIEALADLATNAVAGRRTRD
jgi:protoporphyrin/coproporphyrin ferrochelatase